MKNKHSKRVLKILLLNVGIWLAISAAFTLLSYLYSWPANRFIATDIIKGYPFPYYFNGVFATNGYFAANYFFFDFLVYSVPSVLILLLIQYLRSRRLRKQLPGYSRGPRLISGNSGVIRRKGIAVKTKSLKSFLKNLLPTIGIGFGISTLLALASFFDFRTFRTPGILWTGWERGFPLSFLWGQYWGNSWNYIHGSFDFNAFLLDLIVYFIVALIAVIAVKYGMKIVRI